MTGLCFGNRLWTSLDVMDLKTLMRRRVCLKEASQFLCRNESDVDSKIRELGLWEGRDEC